VSGQSRGRPGRGPPPFRLPLLQHVVKDIGFDPERDVQIGRVLVFEFERQARHFEKRETGAVIHLEKRMLPAALVDLERAGETQAKKILVKDPRLLRVPATIPGYPAPAASGGAIPLIRLYSP
jgi:hypothetical protein